MKFQIDTKRLLVAAVTCIGVLAGTVILSSCDDDEGGTGQTQLQSFGPSPVMRGGELRFIGANLDKVTAVVLPDNVEVTSFTEKSASLLVIAVPEAVVSGKVMLKTPGGDIVTKTMLGIAEPVTITAFTPAAVRPGEMLTIKGTYLNLVKEVIFTNNKSVRAFESQSPSSLSVMVPEDAESGIIVLTDGKEVPNVLKSEAELNVILPVVTGLNPDPVKAGATLTFTGTDLDLVRDVTFEGGTRLERDAFTAQSETEIVLTVPDNAKEGAIVLRPASAVEVTVSKPLALVAPVIASFTPNPAKNNGTITVTGTDLDLVRDVVFGGEKTGTIEDGRTETELVVKVPADATEGTITFNTQNEPVATTAALALVVPTITGITPLTVSTADDPVITLTGTDLDLVKTVVFAGENWTADVTKAVSASPTEIQIHVTPGSLSGNITLVTTNGEEVVSGQSLTIVPEVPAITTIPAEITIGRYVILEGTDMNIPAEIIFPGDVKATNFGAKTATEIKVFVPLDVPQGEGSIRFVTYKNEIYESPVTSFKLPGPEPIVDPALVINDFDEAGHDLGWDNWAGNVALGADAGVGTSGKYMQGTGTAVTGFAWIWGCNHDQLPKPSITTADHVFKVDVKITKPIPADANFQMEFAGSRIDLGNLGGATPGGGWITLTYDLADFPGLPVTIPSSGEWGLNLGSAGAVDITGLYMDNFRFQAK